MSDYLHLNDWCVFDSDEISFGQEHGDHDDAHDKVHDMIEDLDKLTAFCISFLDDGAYGGESQGMKDVGGGLKEEIVLYVEGSIEMKFVYDSEGNNLAIRVKYTHDPDSPVIYLPKASFVATKPDEIEGHHHAEFNYSERGICDKVAIAETKKLLSQGIDDFVIIEGYVWTKDAESYGWEYPDPHTWIELKDRTIIDPSEKQYDREGGIVERIDTSAYDCDGEFYKNAKYYTPLEYLDLWK